MIDVHAHIGWDKYKIWKNSIPKGQPAEELVKKMAANNIEKAIISPQLSNIEKEKIIFQLNNIFLSLKMFFEKEIISNEEIFFQLNNIEKEINDIIIKYKLNEK